METLWIVSFTAGWLVFSWIHASDLKERLMLQKRKFYIFKVGFSLERTR